MKNATIILEITKAMENAPDELLSEVLNLLKNNQFVGNEKFEANLNKILSEDADLLKELAK